MGQLTGAQRRTVGFVAILLSLVSCVLLFALTQIAPGLPSTDPWEIAAPLVTISVITLLTAAVFLRDAGLLHKRIYTFFVVLSALLGLLAVIAGLVNTWDWIRVGWVLVIGVVFVRALLRDFNGNQT